MRLLVRLAIALAAIALLGYLFMKSLESTRSEPYTIARAHLGKWTLVLEDARGTERAAVIGRHES